MLVYLVITIDRGDELCSVLHFLSKAPSGSSGRIAIDNFKPRKTLVAVKTCKDVRDVRLTFPLICVLVLSPLYKATNDAYAPDLFYLNKKRVYSALFAQDIKRDQTCVKDQTSSSGENCQQNIQNIEII